MKLSNYFYLLNRKDKKNALKKFILFLLIKITFEIIKFKISYIIRKNLIKFII